MNTQLSSGPAEVEKSSLGWIYYKESQNRFFHDSFSPFYLAHRGGDRSQQLVTDKMFRVLLFMLPLH
jgi:hypothetical protein